MIDYKKILENNKNKRIHKVLKEYNEPKLVGYSYNLIIYDEAGV